MVEVDLWKIKTRIKDIIQFNATLAGYFRKIHVGAPFGNIPNDMPMPYIFITNDESVIQEDEEASTVQNDVVVTGKNTIHLLLVYMSSKKDGPTTEKDLDDIGMTIKSVLKSNYHLKTPDTLTDQLAFRSYPEEIRPLDRNMVGSEVQGRVIMFKVNAYL